MNSGLVGFHGWQLRETGDGPALRQFDGGSGTMYRSRPLPSVYETAEPLFEALCRRPTSVGRGCSHADDGLVPGERCRCGIYAFTDRETLLRSGYGSGVFGELRLLGKVIEGSGGVVRAQAAEVLRLFCTRDRHVAAATTIADGWGVPLVLPSVMGLSRLVERVVADASPRALADRVHGEHHWRCVAATALDLLGGEQRADAETVFLFALLHDSQPQRGGHGAAAAGYARRLHDEGALGLDEARLEVLCDALERHSAGEVTDDPTTAVCWDADRLHLGRCGGRPVKRLLSTGAAAAVGSQVSRAERHRQEPPGWDALVASTRVAVDVRRSWWGTTRW